MPQKRASFGSPDQPTPPITPSKVAPSPPPSSGGESSSTSKRRRVSQRAGGRDNPDGERDEDAAAPRADRPPPCILLRTGVAATVVRNNFVDLTADDSAEDANTTEKRSLQPQTENAQRQEVRPALLQIESAPVAGIIPHPAEPIAGTPRSRSDPRHRHPHCERTKGGGAEGED